MSKIRIKNNVHHLQNIIAKKIYDVLSESGDRVMIKDERRKNYWLHENYFERIEKVETKRDIEIDGVGVDDSEGGFDDQNTEREYCEGLSSIERSEKVGTESEEAGIGEEGDL